MTQLDDSTIDTLNNLTDNKTTTTLDDPSLNTVSDDDIGEIDYEAKEQGGGEYVPRVYPGVYPFKFELEDENPFEIREYTIKKTGEQVKDFTVNHKAVISIPDSDGIQQEVTIRFCQAGFHQFTNKQGKKFNSQGAELLRSLGITPDEIGGTKPSRALVEQALRAASGRRMGRCVVNWERYDKETKQTISTQGRKGQLRWPKGKDGKYELEVAFPDGDKGYGRERVTGYKLPQG